MSEEPTTPARRFAIAFSFPGEHRDYVKQIDDALCKLLPSDQIFYDDRYKHELARPDLDTYLQTLYHEQSELIVIFLCKEYDQKEWCRLEWRAIRDIIKKRRESDVMPFRFDHADIPGVFSIDGYINAGKTTPSEAAQLIHRRLFFNRNEQLPPSSPLSPLHLEPYFAHPYPLQSHFTGRLRERQLLSSWLASDPHPILALIALGGMGKSALAWAFLQHDLLQTPLPDCQLTTLPNQSELSNLKSQIPGVLWWSFYEQDAAFPAFLDHALVYCSAGSIDPASVPSAHDKLTALLDLLRNNRFLLILDGFERELRAYASLSAAYQGDAVTDDPNQDYRACTHPLAARFLRAFAALPTRSRILLTSRLFPKELDGLPACRREDLTALDPDDAVKFFHAHNIQGTRAEIQAACAPYDYHPLALRLLAGTITCDPQYPSDIRAAPDCHLIGDLKARQHHILQVAYDAAPQPQRELLSRLAAFRSTIAYPAIQALALSPSPATPPSPSPGTAPSPSPGTPPSPSPGTPGEGRGEGSAQPPHPPTHPATAEPPLPPLFPSPSALKSALHDLTSRGLLLFDASQACYDLHPIIRQYAYDRLSDKSAAHASLRDYFAAIPAPDKIERLEDLTPAIELYHHTVHAAQCDAAVTLFRDRLAEPLFYRFAAYQTCIDLLLALFLDRPDRPPRLKVESAQAWSLNDLAASYTLSGQPRRAIPLFQMHNTIQSRRDVKPNLAIGLMNLACVQLSLGHLATAERNFRQSIQLSHDAKRDLGEAAAHTLLGLLLAHQALFDQASEELSTALAYCEQTRNLQGQSLVHGYLGQQHLFMCNPAAALQSARQARRLAEETAKTIYPVERNFIRAERLHGASLLALASPSPNTPTPPQTPTPTLPHPDTPTLLQEAESHLNEALTRCRRVNMIEMEPDILLSFSRFHRLRGDLPQAYQHAHDALTIADRCEYRLIQADIHNFLAQLAIDQDKPSDAAHHARIAYERAWCDGPPHCYKPALDLARTLLSASTPSGP